MSVERVDLQRREPYEPGTDFGAGGGYERLDGVAHYAVDPDHPSVAGIVDLGRARRDPDGLVRFHGDVTVLRPIDASRGARTVVLDVPNRGRRVMTTLFNRGVPDLPPTERIPAGDGFLQRRGLTLAWCGWQWDVPADPTRMGFRAPVAVGTDGRPLTGWMQLRLQLGADTACVALTDQHVGPIGAHDPIPTADVDDPDAVLYVRDGLHDEPVALPRDQWRFARVDGGRVVPDAGSLWVEGGLQAGRIHDLVYRVATCPVVGTGLLAVRDLAAFLRSDRQDNPVAGTVDRVVLTGMSQNSRFLRTLLHLGLDRDELGAPAFDGVLGLVGGGRRGEFNARFAQPSVQPTPGFGHLFPFADLPQTDPRTGRTEGLLDRIAARPDPPRIVFVDTAAEYWRGDASLAHTHVADGRDVDDAPFVRRYLYAGTQHGPGLAALTNRTLQGGVGANLLDVLDYTPLYRAALVNLLAWITDATEPPASAVPRSTDGTAATREQVLARLAALPGLTLPQPEQLPVLRALDLGPDADDGVGRWPARPFGAPYPCVVSAVDDDGNEVAGVRLPDVAVPIGTHCGFNPRHPDTGAPGQLLEYSGSTLPFARTRTERLERGDPRPSLEERYDGPEDYAERVRAAAGSLVAARHLLPDDVELCVRLARKRWSLIAGPTG